MNQNQVNFIMYEISDIVERCMARKQAERPRIPTEVTLADGTSQVYDLPALKDFRDDLQETYEEVQRALNASRAINFARHGLPHDGNKIEVLAQTRRPKRRKE